MYQFSIFRYIYVMLISNSRTFPDDSVGFLSTSHFLSDHFTSYDSYISISYDSYIYIHIFFSCFFFVILQPIVSCCSINVIIYFNLSVQSPAKTVPMRRRLRAGQTLPILQTFSLDNIPKGGSGYYIKHRKNRETALFKV